MKQKLKILTVIYFAPLSGLVLFAVVAFLRHNRGNSEVSTFMPNFPTVVSGFVVLMFVLSMIVPKILLRNVQNKNSFHEKWMVYQSASIIRWAMLEGAAFFPLVIYYLGADMFYLKLTGIVVLLYLIQFPYKKKIINELQLSKEETNS